MQIQMGECLLYLQSVLDVFINIMQYKLEGQIE